MGVGIDVLIHVSFSFFVYHDVATLVSVTICSDTPSQAFLLMLHLIMSPPSARD